MRSTLDCARLCVQKSCHAYLVNKKNDASECWFTGLEDLLVFYAETVSEPLIGVTEYKAAVPAPTLAPTPAPERED